MCRGDTCADTARFYWERAPRWRAVGWGDPGELLCHMTQSPSWWCTHRSQDGRQQEGFWEVVGHVVSPFDLSQTLPIGGGLLVPCSLPGPPVIKQLSQWLLWCLARVGGCSPCASPDTWVCLPGHGSSSAAPCRTAAPLLLNTSTRAWCTVMLPSPSLLCSLHNRPVNHEVKCWGKKYNCIWEAGRPRRGRASGPPGTILLGSGCQFLL